MNAALTPQDRLLSQLIELARSDEPLPCMRVFSLNAYLLRACEVDSAVLALPLQGYKRGSEGGLWVEAHPGDIFVVPSGRVVDIANIPDPHSGEYLAIAIPLHDSVLEAVRQLLHDPVMPDDGRIAAVPMGDMVEGLLRWCDALRDGRKPHACHAMAGVVLRLYEMGHHGLLKPPAPRLSVRIRRMVAEDPARDWASADIETTLGLSGPTLRRRLAEESASLRDIIAEARLSCGLNLLLSTRLPVKSVAARVGYASASSFVKRFSERYGVEPSRVASVS